MRINNGRVTSVAKKINNELLTKSIIATFILYQKQKYKGQNILGIFVPLGTINPRGGQTVLGNSVRGTTYPRKNCPGGQI